MKNYLARILSLYWWKLLVFALVVVVGVLLVLAFAFDPNFGADYVNVIKFNDIVYMQVSNNASFPGSDLVYFDRVRFKMAGNTNYFHYKFQNGDATYLDAGTRLYSINDYSPNFRLVTEDGNLYEALAR
jgi:hypothetical protein